MNVATRLTSTVSAAIPFHQLFGIVFMPGTNGMYLSQLIFHMAPANVKNFLLSVDVDVCLYVGMYI